MIDCLPVLGYPSAEASDALVMKVAEQVLDDVVPVPHERGPRNLTKPAAHHVGDVPQGPKGEEVVRKYIR